jgi:hypothetical protein
MSTFFLRMSLCYLCFYVANDCGKSTYRCYTVYVTPLKMLSFVLRWSFF